MCRKDKSGIFASVRKIEYTAHLTKEQRFVISALLTKKRRTAKRNSKRIRRKSRHDMQGTETQQREKRQLQRMDGTRVIRREKRTL